MLKLFKHSEKLLKYNGFVSYSTCNYENVVIEGKTYTNTTYTDKKSSVDELREKNNHFFLNYSYDFTLIDYKISIEDYSGFLDRLSIIADKNYRSTNPYVSALIQAFDFGLLDTRIKSVFTGKRDYYDYYPVNYKRSFNRILESMEINIPFYKYGFNNLVYYTISVRDLFEVDANLVPKNIKEMFYHNGIFIDSKDKLKEVQKLLIKKAGLCNQ